MSLTTSLAALAALILASGFFSGTESAFTSLSPAQAAIIQQRWGRRGKLVGELMARPDRLLTTVLIGNNLMNIGAGALATQITIELFGSAAVGIMTGILTLVMLIFAEVTPKQLAISNNEFICVHTARVVYWLSLVLTPLIIFIGGFSRIVARVSGGRGKRTLTLESILQIVRQAEHLGILEQYKSRLLKNLFRFSDIPVSAVMTHRREVISLDRSVSISAALAVAGETGLGRIPVYDGDPEKIVGVVLAKDLIRQRDRGDTPIRTIMLEPVFIPEQRRIDLAMKQILREKLNMAIVLDEYGGLAGVVTIEDILEEIVGEIYDEHETRERGKIINLGDDRYLLRADIPLSVANDFLPVPLKSSNSDVHTLGGFLAELLGRIPTTSEKIETVSGVFEVTRMDKNRLVELIYSRDTSLRKAGHQEAEG